MDPHWKKHREPWFDRPFKELGVLSHVEGLTVLREIEGKVAPTDPKELDV